MRSQNSVAFPKIIFCFKIKYFKIKDGLYNSCINGIHICLHNIFTIPWDFLTIFYLKIKIHVQLINNQEVIEIHGIF